MEATLVDVRENWQCESAWGGLPIHLPANGALLAAISLMAAGWDGAATDCPGFPRDGGWTVRHEGFTPWP